MHVPFKNLAAKLLNNPAPEDLQAVEDRFNSTPFVVGEEIYVVEQDVKEEQKEIARVSLLRKLKTLNLTPEEKQQLKLNEIPLD